MSDILQGKALSNKIEEALKEKVIGDVYVEYTFDSTTFGTSIVVAINEPSNKQKTFYYNDPRWYFRVTLDEFIIKKTFDNKEETSKLISEIVDNILDKYKEHVYKRYFFD